MKLAATAAPLSLLLLLLPASAVAQKQRQQQQGGDATQKLIEQLEDEIVQQRRLLNDWGGLTRYGSENAEVKLTPGVNRVVFLGDEITGQWGASADTAFFPGKPHYFNRGIAHQTAGQMLVRFRQDVIGLKPKAVVIQTGLNDLAGYAGPATQGTIAEHIMTMMDLAKAHGIRVVLTSVTPVCDCVPGQVVTIRRPPGKIIGLNGWLKEYASETGAVYLDYYSALVEGRAFKKELTADGILPNAAGYRLMTPLAEAAIAQALK